MRNVIILQKVCEMDLTLILCKKVKFVYSLFVIHIFHDLICKNPYNEAGKKRYNKWITEVPTHTKTPKQRKKKLKPLN